MSPSSLAQRIQALQREIIDVQLTLHSKQKINISIDFFYVVKIKEADRPCIRTLNTLGPLFISNGSEPNRSVLPLRPVLLPLLDCEMVRRGAAIFGGGATANRPHKD